MWQATFIVATLAVIASSSLVIAQQPERGDERRQLSPQDNRTEKTGAVAHRLSILREILRLSPEQGKHWPAYEASIEALELYHRDYRIAWQQADRADPSSNIRQRAEVFTDLGALLSQVADTMETLYGSL